MALGVNKILGSEVMVTDGNSMAGFYAPAQGRDSDKSDTPETVILCQIGTGPMDGQDHPGLQSTGSLLQL